MKRGLSVLAAAGLAFSGTALGATAAHAVDLEFPDAELTRAINNEIDPNRASDATITLDDIQPVHELLLDETYQIESLEGLEAFNDKQHPFLHSVTFHGTFQDLSPIESLEHLVIVNLHSPNVTNIPNLGAQDLSSLNMSGTSIDNLNNVPEQLSNNDGWLAFGNTLVTDLSPISGANYTVVAGQGNAIKDISSVPDTAEIAYFADQVISLEQVAVGDEVVNPLRDRNGNVVEVTSNAAGFVNDSNTWSFTQSGTYVLDFEWTEGSFDMNGVGTVFSGTVSIEVSEGVIAAGDATITGDAGLGKTLAAETSGFEPGDVDFEYQWFVDGEPVTGETGATFTPTAGDEGKEVTVQVTATKEGYGPETVMSDPVTVATPAVVVSPDSVQPGDEVTITGENFAPGEDVIIELPDGSTVTVTADENGSFATTVTVPEGTEPGDYVVTAMGTESETIVEAPFTVSAAPATGDEEEAVTGGKGGPADPAGDSSSKLAYTGSEAAPMFLIAAAALLVTGAGLLTARSVLRRRSL